jgi:Ca2+-binding RTX toxin-like protein
VELIRIAGFAEIRWFPDISDWEACMTTHIIHSDRHTYLQIKGNHGTWIVAADASISTSGSAIFEESGLHDNKIVIDGDLKSWALQSVGAWLWGNNTDVVVGGKSEIIGDVGILFSGKSPDIVNHGEIHAGSAAISSKHAAHVVNDGQLTANTNIAVAAGSHITNTTDGEILAGETGISITGDKASRILNNGLLTGNMLSVQDGDGALTLVNHGKIYGAINLGAGDDVLDIRDGYFGNDIYGGQGNDTFLVSSKNRTITEGVGEGIDTVKSTTGYVLGDNLDNLFLLGKGNTKGTGNDLANFLFGNAGEDRLSGLDGADILNGKKGNDLLIGGLGGDNFVFHQGSGIDTVQDYTDDEDKIAILNFPGINSFADLQPHIHQHDVNDVWITLGNGDKLILQNTSAASLDMNDFSFGGP